MEGLFLPKSDGTLERYQLVGTPVPNAPCDPPRTRLAYAAAHVVANPFADVDPSSDAAIDWDATLAYRRHLWSLGLSVAEAMDTAQRGMGFGWDKARELIRRSVADAQASGGKIACGAGTDQLELTPSTTLIDVQRAYEEQCEFIEAVGGQIILMASRGLASVANTPDDYARVYDAILNQVSEPVILHWLGDMFDPALSGYWGDSHFEVAMELCLDLIRRHAAKIDGIKISLLDADLERLMRRRLPVGVRMYTGDDFNYPDLIRLDDGQYSHALLGIFDAIAPVAAQALHALDVGDEHRFMDLFAPTVPLSRHIFQTPTRFYKTGVVFLAYLNAHQTHFRMVGGMESARSLLHLSELFRLADHAGLFADPECAVERMQRILAVAGVGVE